MMIDFVLPSSNADGFMAIAKRLSIEGLCIVEENPRKIMGAYSAQILKKRSARQGDLSVMIAPDDARLAIEKVRPDIIFCAENMPKSDFIHQRNSGLNHIVCTLARDYDIAIGFAFTSCLGKYGARAMGRMSANIRMCRKYKVPMVIASLATDPMLMRTPEDLKSLFITIGMHPSEAKQAFETASRIIQRNRKIRSGMIIADGAEIV
jgi:RNase P/RNase MRP subunit p30